MSEFPELTYLFRAYFHQDMFADTPSWKDAVRQFVDENRLEKVLAAAGELTLLRSRGLSERELDLVVESMGCCYSPISAGIDMSAWLDELTAELELVGRRRSGGVGPAL